MERKKEEEEVTKNLAKISAAKHVFFKIRKKGQPTKK